MARRWLSIGFFGLFGRSPELREFDTALRSVDLHPKLVPEAVKLTAVNLVQERVSGRAPERQSYREAAEIIAYCMTGGEAFAAANDARLAAAVEERIEAALAHGTSLDARLVLLTLHAKVIQPSVVSDFGLESGD
ncbi:MAG: hypothetical protein AB7V40_02400 [Methyloceanibacter sp.]